MVQKLAVPALPAESTPSCSFAESMDSRVGFAICSYCGDILESGTSWHAKRDLLFCSEVCKEIRCGSVSFSGSEFEVRRDSRSWLLD